MKHRGLTRVWAVVCACAFCLGSALTLAGCKRQPQKFSTSWFDVFDTVVILTGYAESQAAWDAEAAAVHTDLLHYHRLFDIYNEYDGLVNLCTVNKTAGTEPVAVPEDLFAFLQFGQEMYTLTEGACNMAAGALLGLWHAAREQETPAPPAEDLLENAAQHCDMADLVLENGTVHFTTPALQLDVGAIGKGYAVEQAAKAAEARGMTSELINAGGNVRAIGSKPDGTLWTAGVENPWQSDGKLVASISLQPGESLVISGDYQRFFEYEGVRYHHLIDLATHQPARYVSSVAVRSTKGSGLCDALSTGLFCSPLDSGRALAERLDGVEVLWMLPDGTTQSTDGFLQ